MLRLATQTRITEQTVRTVHRSRTQRHRLVQVWRWTRLRLMLRSLFHSLTISPALLLFDVDILLLLASSFTFAIGLASSLAEPG
jgi:hypothetical protein